jgi:GDPmannose 4,6-dehydratase
MKAIIFGINGQDGQYLSELLKSNNCEVTGVGKGDNPGNTDITKFDSVLKLVDTIRPDYIFHLAAHSSTSHEFILQNHETICTGTLNILEAVKKYSPVTKVFISGSGLQFKNEGKPINETYPFEARDAYSMSRIHSVYTARYYRKLGIKVYIGYFFNHDSPLRTEQHMTKRIAEAAKRINEGSTENIEIGDISAVKEYSFAGDIVKAVWMLVNQEKIYETVIGSGEGHSIEEWLTECFDLIGKNWKDYVVPNKAFAPEYERLVSDPGLLFSLGWKPGVSFRQLAKMMMQ